MDWRDLPTEEVERHFNPRLAAPDYERYFRLYDELSAAAAARLPPRRDLRYGDGPLETLDVWRRNARGRLPIYVFIHGGYWRTLDKKAVEFAVEPFAQAGALGINLNYDLCPPVTLDQIVVEVRHALVWLWRHAEELGGDRERIVLAGHSAGAHLAAMCLNHDWRAHGLPEQPVTGALLLSAVLDTEAVLHTSINADVRLDRAAALRNSPLAHPPTEKAQVLTAVGDAEPDAWIAQSTAYHEACRARGLRCDYWRMAGEHHFSALLPLADLRHPLSVAVLRMLGL